MTGKERYLVVISVLEGRKFPKRARHKIIAEARFDGELLATDPVDHVETPDFTQELAWELDKKALQQHRLQRTSIKIQCFAYDVQSTLKEAIGYVILDLRAATTNKQVAKWHQILHSKYHKSKPEIRLALYLDDDKNPSPGILPGLSPVRAIDEADLAKGLQPHTLKPALNEDEGYYQIGPAKRHTEQFVLSVTIAYASNLAQLIPSTLPLPASGGYFFYYSLLGNDVTNESFADLINPSFPAERASVRLRSSVDALRVFFHSQPGIQIHLCCGDQSLGSCEVPLASLIKKGSTEIYMKPVTIDGAFQLIPPNKTKQQLPPMASDLTPNVGVSVVLRKEDMATVTPVKDTPASGGLRSVGASPILKGHADRHSPTHAGVAQQERPKVTQTKPRPEEVKVKAKERERDEDDYTETFEDENTPDNVSDLGDEQNNNGKQSSGEVAPPVGSVEPDRNQYPATKVLHSAATPISESTTQHHVSIPAQSHHFIFSIDLRSIRDHISTHTNNVYLKYSYPFFGVASPVLTNPPVEIRKGMEVLLPQSFCAFSFACPLQQLQDMFLRVPLIVEIWHRDRQLSKDILLGGARLPLGQIITVDKSKVMNNTGGSGWRQEYSDRIAASSVDGKSACMFEISTVLSLEDWGPLPTQPVIPSSENQGLSSGYAASGVESGGGIETSPRQSAEYKAALELEMWKEGQEQAFENQLKQKEAAYMRALAEEWKKRDREREVLLQKKVVEYTLHEEQLKKALTSLEKRDKQLAVNEQEVLRLQADLQRDHERKLQEMKEASHRHKEDCDHKVELERMKANELEELVSRYKQELADGDKKLKSSEKEFSIYKEQQNTKPEVQLQSEINLLTLEKVELERKLDAVSKSKVHYKQQWGRALKELARLKQREQDVARAQLKKQQQELEHMRLRYLAAEEKDVVQAEKKELEDIKNQLNKLKLIEEERLKSSTDSNNMQLNSPKQINGHKSHDLDSSLDEHITRLIEERDTLLKTGAYTTQDKIIAELDRQIREAIAHKNS
ncbi:centrosomal protein of 120 kDa-like [Haliotis cracherodii]|uniref:centrosomal protein of 120 kDa-like n=1 Tax=Haliotis cracherodii TaxID=6455 RepID=UPI0039EA8A33